MSRTREVDLDGRVALWTAPRSASAMLVVAHGAGAGMRHPLLAGIADGVSAAGVATLRFDFPFAAAGRRRPDPPPVLLGAWRSALAAAARLGDGLPLAASGKSLGGRMASVLAAEEGEAFAARALVFFGYPLHPPGRPERRRGEHLPFIRVPMLFIQGTADPFAEFELIEEVVGKLEGRARLHAVPGGDHSFRVRAARRDDIEIGRDLGTIAAAFVREVV